MHRQEPVLVGKRIIVRLAQFKDDPEIIRYFRENERHLGEYEKQKPADFYSEEFWRRQIELQYEEYQRDQSCKMFLFDNKDDARVLGVANLFGLHRGAFHACYLGYSVAERWQGQGIMLEALLLVIEFAFKEMNLHRIMANYMPQNERSGHLLERLGFVKEGDAKDYLYINDRWRDHVLTSLTNPDWLPPEEPTPEADAGAATQTASEDSAVDLPSL